MPDKINVIANLLNIFAFESITVGNTAIGFSTGIIYNSEGAYVKKVLVTIESAQLRWRADGAVPTSTEGHLLQPGDVLTLIGLTNIKNFRAIRTGGTSAKMSASYSL